MAPSLLWITSAYIAEARSGQGVIEGSKIICPWHGWAFDTKTGEAAHNASAKVVVYPLKVEDGDVMIQLYT